MSSNPCGGQNNLNFLANGVFDCGQFMNRKSSIVNVPTNFPGLEVSWNFYLKFVFSAA